MKKASTEVDKQHLAPELETRLAAMEARLEKLDPTPKLETIEPYGIGTIVYSISDSGASFSFVVKGYDHRAGRILVQHDNDPERALALESVQPLSKCRNAQPTPEQIDEQLYGHLDPRRANTVWAAKKQDARRSREILCHFFQSGCRHSTAAVQQIVTTKGFSMSAKGFFLAQDDHLVDLIKPVSASAAQASTRFNMTMYAHASIVVRFGAAGGPIGAITLSVYNALTGGSGVAIPFKYFVQNSSSAPFDLFGSMVQATSAGYTPSSDAADMDVIIEIDADDILVAANGTYVELDIAVGSVATTPQLLDAFGVLSGGPLLDPTISAQV